MPKKNLVAQLVEEDFGIAGNGKWLRGIIHDSLVVDTERDLFFWNKHNIYGNALDYLIKVRGLSSQEAKKKLSRLDGSIIYSEIDCDGDSLPYIKLVNAFYENGKTNRQYWYDRLLTDDTIDRFQLGYYNTWYTIPIFEDGKFVNIQKRRDIPEKGIYPWYRGRPSLFNSGILKIVDEVFLTEGIVDCILLNQFGFPAVSKSTGATTWLDEWSKFFMKTKRVYVVFDNDDAGRNGAKRISKLLGEYKCKIYTFDGFNDKYDIVDYFRDGNDKEDFEGLVIDKSKYLFEV